MSTGGWRRRMQVYFAAPAEGNVISHDSWHVKKQSVWEIKDWCVTRKKASLKGSLGVRATESTSGLRERWIMQAVFLISEAWVIVPHGASGWSHGYRLTTWCPVSKVSFGVLKKEKICWHKLYLAGETNVTKEYGDSEVIRGSKKLRAIDKSTQWVPCSRQIPLKAVWNWYFMYQVHPLIPSILERHRKGHRPAKKSILDIKKHSLHAASTLTFIFQSFQIF